MDKLQEAKKLLGSNDNAIFKAEDIDYEMDKTCLKKPSDFVDVEPSESTGQMHMILTIRKPDLLGHAQWEFRHGNDALSATISDEPWLLALHKGEINITSGSSMACDVVYEYIYDKSGILASKHHEIIKVHRLIEPNPPSQGDWLR